MSDVRTGTGVTCHIVHLPIVCRQTVLSDLLYTCRPTCVDPACTSRVQLSAVHNLISIARVAGVVTGPRAGRLRNRSSNPTKGYRLFSPEACESPLCVTGGLFRGGRAAGQGDDCTHLRVSRIRVSGAVPPAPPPAPYPFMTCMGTYFHFCLCL